VGHVDDAHQAKGDREAEGGNEQHGGEAQAAKGRADETDGLDGEDALGGVGRGEIGKIEHGLHGTAQRGGVFDGRQIGGVQAQRAGRAGERGAGVDAEGGLGVTFVLGTGELDGNLGPVGRREDEQLVRAPGFEERSDGVVAASHQRSDQLALGGGVLGEGGAHDDFTRRVGGAGGGRGHEQKRQQPMDRASEKIHRRRAKDEC
jgi:hypothetical protein